MRWGKRGRPPGHAGKRQAGVGGGCGIQRKKTSTIHGGVTPAPNRSNGGGKNHKGIVKWGTHLYQGKQQVKRWGVILVALPWGPQSAEWRSRGEKRKECPSCFQTSLRRDGIGQGKETQKKNITKKSHASRRYEDDQALPFPKKRIKIARQSRSQRSNSCRSKGTYRFWGKEKTKHILREQPGESVTRRKNQKKREKHQNQA